MQENYNDLIKKLKNKKIMFCGLGRSNIPFINMLTSEKINIIAYDSKKKESFDESVAYILENNPYVNLRLADETVWDEDLDIIIKTPGMNFLSDKITDARKRGILVTSEMEIFFDLCPCRIIGITGSDGKTTVTTIISQILKNQGFKVHVGGNIGMPLLPEINKIKKEDIAVVELSSFQLISMRRSPDIAVITNVSPNHLDVHKDMKEYIEAKKQIILHQNAFSKAVLNYDNPETQKMSDDVRGELVFFSRKEKLNNGVWINENKDIIFSSKGENQKIINTSDIKVPGNHNIENYLAAIACVKELAGSESIKSTATSFSGVAHRIEFIKDVNGVSYYNDSIASSPNRTISGTLSLFDKKIILIAGGYDKKIPFDSLAREIVKKASVLILLGETTNKIENEITKLKDYSKEKLAILKTSSMEDAVKKAAENSKSGDIVVLSPACASFDLYKDFEERGNHFKAIVNNMK